MPLLYRAIDAVNTAGLHVVLFGDRGVGKTSIARVLAYNVQEPAQAEGARAILVSCTSTDDYSTIWRKVFQEIQLAQRQLGFVQHDAAVITGHLDLTQPITSPNDVRLLVRSLPNPSIIVIDEFDRVPSDGTTQTLMADTIKLFSDTDVDSTVVLVGVADSLAELIGTHPSIARNIAQLKVEPMGSPELVQIVQRGYERAGMQHDPTVAARIADLSQGYPHYTHLLGLWAGRRAIEAGRLNVLIQDVEDAVPDALENATGGVQHEYERAVASVRPMTLYKEVLLACALAQKDSLGRFTAVNVRSPLRQITGAAYDTGAFQSHLARFCETDRGPVLKKTGTRRNYRWQFVNPQLIPYVRMKSLVTASSGPGH